MRTGSSQRTATPAQATSSSPDDIFRAIADYTYDWESWTDLDGVTRWVNPAVERITGFTVAECLAMPGYPLPLVHADDRTTIAQALAAAQKGGSGNDLEFRVSRKDGRVAWGAISWQSVFDSGNQCRGYRTSVRDISERKRDEEELREAKAAAEQASRAKGEFLANMSHEIRSPIQCISGYAQLLTKTKLSPKQHRYVTILCQQNDALLKVVDDILDFSALQAVTPKLERVGFDVADVVQQVVEAARPQAFAKKIKLTAEVEPTARLSLAGDVHRLRQILANLVNNAIKFTERGSVRLQVLRTDTGEDREHAELSFSIQDTGIGISARSLRQLFRPFSQADSSTARRFGGTGLGLAISRRLAELMGGALKAQSELGRGSTFAVSLPFAIGEPSLGQGRPLQQKPRALPDLSILVVEDSAVALDLAIELLAVLGYKADGAANGAEALVTLEEKRYDVVLMDVQMPVMDGLTLTRMIRRRRWPLGHQPTIVALTANVLADDRRACLEAGMDAFLGKPLRLEDLHAYLAGLNGHPPLGAVKPAASGANLVPIELDAKILLELQHTTNAEGKSLFDRYAPRVIEELRQLISDVDRVMKMPSEHTQLADLVHKVKGHARTMGATETALMAEALEGAARAGEPRKPLRAWPRLRKSLLRFIFTLETLLQPHLRR